MKVVGVTAKQSRTPRQLDPPLTLAYFCQSVMAAGGLPLLVPMLDVDPAESWYRSLKLSLADPSTGPSGINPAILERADAVLDRMDCLLLTGGEDIDPYCYGCTPTDQVGKVNPRRDASELLLAYRALRRRMPVLAICRGMQLVNVLLGGSLTLHLEPAPGGISHERAYHGGIPPDYWAPQHEIEFVGDSLLSACFDGLRRVPITSYHHQAIKDLAPGLKLTARADDGCIEAYEPVDPYPYLVGIQGHPEVMWPHDYEQWLRIFEALIRS